MDILDAKKIKRLLETYSYDTLMNKFRLNESFSENNNIFRYLFKINKQKHIGLTGNEEDALSPVGAAFALAFPISWDKIPEENVKILVDPNVYEHIPSNMDSFSDNDYSSGIYNGLTYTEKNKFYNERRRYKLGSYVDELGDYDRLIEEFEKSISYIEKLIDRCDNRITYLNGNLDSLDVVDDEEKITETDNKIKEESDRKILYDKCRNLLDRSIEKLENTTDEKENYDVDPNDPKIVDLKLPLSVMSSLKKAHDMFNDDRFYTTDTDYTGKKFKTHFGIRQYKRVRGDYFDRFNSGDDMLYVRVSDFFDKLKNASTIIKETDILDYKSDNDGIIDYIDDILSGLEKNRKYHSYIYDDKEKLKDSKNHILTHIKNRFDIGLIKNYFRDQIIESSYPQKTNDSSKNASSLESFYKKLKNFNEIFDDCYDECKKELKNLGSSDSYKLVKNLYSKSEVYGSGSKARLRNTICQDIKSYNFESDKDGKIKDSDDNSGSDNPKGKSILKLDKSDDFELVFLTDQKFKILYVLSLVRLNDYGYGYSLSNKYLYGWSEGMNVSVSEVTRDIHGIMGGNIKFDYREIDPDKIASDTNISSAIVVSGNFSIDVKNKDNHTINTNGKKRIVTSIEKSGRVITDYPNIFINALERHKIPYFKDEKGVLHIDNSTLTQEKYYVLLDLFLSLYDQSGFGTEEISDKFNSIIEIQKKIDKFNPTYFKKMEFSNYYSDEIYKYTKNSIQKIKAPKKYNIYLSNNDYRDSESIRIKYDKERLNLYKKYINEKNEILDDINNFVMDREFDVKIYLDSIEDMNMRKNVISRQFLSGVRRNRYKTEQEYNSEYRRGLNGISSEYGNVYNSKYSDYNKYSDELKNIIYDINGYKSSYKPSGRNLNFTDLMKKSGFKIESIKNRIEYIINRCDNYMRIHKNYDEISKKCKDLFDKYKTFISDIDYRLDNTIDDDGRVKMLQRYIPIFNRSIDDFVNNDLYSIGITGI